MNIREWIEENYENVLFADGFDEAILGVAVGCGRPEMVIYDVKTCVKILVERDGMTEEDAVDFLDFNTVGAYVGEHTPMFLFRP